MCPSISGIRKYSELRTDGAALDWYDNYLRGMRAIHAELNAIQNELKHELAYSFHPSRARQPIWRIAARHDQSHSESISSVNEQGAAKVFEAHLSRSLLRSSLMNPYMAPPRQGIADAGSLLLPSWIDAVRAVVNQSSFPVASGLTQLRMKSVMAKPHLMKMGV